MIVVRIMSLMGGKEMVASDGGLSIVVNSESSLFKRDFQTRQVADDESSPDGLGAVFFIGKTLGK